MDSKDENTFTIEVEGEGDDQDSSEYIICFGNGEEIKSSPIPVPSPLPREMSESSVESSSAPGQKSSSAGSSLECLVAEATRFSAEIRRLTGELNAANERIEEQDYELLQRRNQISKQKSLIDEQQRRIETLENEGIFGIGVGDTCHQDIRELKSMVATEIKGRTEAEEKLENLKKSMKSVISEEFGAFFEDLKENFGGNLNGDSLERSVETLQDKLDRLCKFVQDRIGILAENQVDLKTQLANMSKMVLHLSGMMASNSTKLTVRTPPAQLPQSTRSGIATPKRNESLEQDQGAPGMPFLIKQTHMRKRKRSSTTEGPRQEPLTSLISPPPKRFGTTETSPKELLNATLEHSKDLAKMRQGAFFCICGMECTTRSNLWIHIQTYTKVEKFKCDVCDQRFALYYMLKQHLKDKHNITAAKGSVGCGECAIVFGSLSMLYEHRKTEHTGTAALHDQDASCDFNTEDVYEDENDDIGDHEIIDPNHANPAPTSVTEDGNTPRVPSAKNSATKKYASVIKTTPTAAKRMEENGGEVADHDNGLPEEEEEEEDHNRTQDHGIHPTNELSCICGFVTPIKYNLTKHIKWNTMDRKFSCKTCSLKFLNLSNLRHHYLRSHKDVEMYNEIKMKSGCSKCGKIFESMLDLQRHRRTVHGVKMPFPTTKMVKPFKKSVVERPAYIRNSKGQFAGKRRNFRLQLQNQMSAANYRGQRAQVKGLVSSGKFECNLCPAKYTTYHQLSRHRKGSHKIVQKEFAIGCVDCGITFSTRKEHRHHRVTVHQSAIGRKRLIKSEISSTPVGLAPSSQMYTEPKAVPIFLNDEDYDDEQQPSTSRGHQTNFSPTTLMPIKSENECPQAPKIEGRPQVNHGVDAIMARQGYYCLCGKNLNTERALLSHIRYHSRERNLPCHYCDHRFIGPSYLKQHIERSHKNVSGVPSVLNRCKKRGKSFQAHGQLHRHNKAAHNKTTKTYSDVLNHRGEECQQQLFATDENGVVHQVADLGTVSGTPRCSCGKQYLSKGALYRHIHVQAEGKVFKCHLCPKKYIEHSTLRKHLRISHRINYQGRRFACGVCAQAFGSHRDVIKHRVQAHGRPR